MATTRIKDISSTVTSLASDDYVAVDGATNGTRKMVRGSIYTDVAAAFTGAPTTYDICPLNSGTGKIDATYLPTSGDTPKGEWNASTNSPSLIDGTGTAGDYYDVTTAGSQDLGSGSITFTVGDVVKYNGSTWYKIDSVANFLDGYSTAATSRTALEVNSIAEDAEATGTKLVGPALYFDGVNDFLEVADDAKLSFTDGTDDLPFSISAFINMDDATGFPVATKHSAAREWVFRTDGADKLILNLSDGTNIPEIVTDTALTAYEGQWIHVCVTRPSVGPNGDQAFASSEDGTIFYINGQAVAATASNNDNYTGMSDGGDPVYIGRHTSTRAKGHIRNVQIFNRELTAAEVAQLARGVDLGFADEYGGEFGSPYTANWSSTTDSWANSNTTLTQASGPVGGRSNVLQITANAGNSTHAGKRTISDVTVGKRYRVVFDYYLDAGNSHADGIKARFDNGTYQALSAVSGAWTRYEFEVVATANILEVYMFDGALQTFDDTGGDDKLWLDNLSVTEIGTLADFRAENYDSDTGKIYDISDNAFVGTSANLPTLTGRAYPVYETGTWTPSITFGGGSTGITYTTQEGLYTRVGNTVWVSAYVLLSAKGSDTGTALINGLPFTASNTAASSQSFTVGNAANAANLTSAITAYATDNGTTINLVDWGATGSAVLDDTNFAATTALSISGTYQIQ